MTRQDSNALIAELTAAIEKKTAAIASAAVETAQAEDDHGSTVEELEALSEVKADLHGRCDFVLKSPGPCSASVHMCFLSLHHRSMKA